MAPEIIDMCKNNIDKIELKKKDLVIFYQKSDAFSMGATILAAADLVEKMP